MKTNLSLCLFAVVCLLSCAGEDSDTIIDRHGQTWQLVRMTGSMIHSETMGPDMAWQEYIMLAGDGYFVKSRQQEGKVTEATGRYSRSTSDDATYVVLVYASGYELMASCHSGLANEHLRVVSPTSMIGTWNACDGPGLEYQLVEEETIKF